jgi:hypothetical protein
MVVILLWCFLVIVGQLQLEETLKQSIVLSTKFFSLLRWKQQKQDQQEKANQCFCVVWCGNHPQEDSQIPLHVREECGNI